MKKTFFALSAIISTIVLSTNVCAAGAMDLFKDPTVLKQIKDIQKISDTDYDILRKKVLNSLAQDKLISSTDFTFSDIGLGYDQYKNRLLVEAKPESKNFLRLFVFPDKIEVDALFGGEKFKGAFQTYVNSLGANDLQSQLFRIGGVEYDLAYLMAVVNKEVTPLAVDLDKYQKKHDTTKVMSIVKEVEPHKGEQLIQIQFNEKNFDYSRTYPGPGITADNFGTVRFYPYAVVGQLKSDTAVGSCVRVCQSVKEVACQENTTRQSCESQEAFGGAVRCPVSLLWNQNLKCAIAQKLIER